MSALDGGSMTRIPDSALTQHVIALGKTRSGKSYAMHGLAEMLIERARRVCILTPTKSDWWGLKASADGKAAGYPVTIFASPESSHVDIPINERAGKPLAKLIADGASPTIVDLSKFGVGERTRFAIEFARELLRSNLGTLYLFIDEAHNFMPQGKVPDPDTGKMLHAFNALVTEGLGNGIHVIAMSQRPAKVHKDSVTQMDTLVAFRVVHVLDRDAIDDWIDACGDAAKAKQVLPTLGTMARGDGWVWSAEAGFGPVVMHFPKITTFDSHRTPDPDEVVKPPKVLAKGDLDAIRAHLGDAIKEAEANDPKELRKRIAELEREARRWYTADGKFIVLDADEVIRRRKEAAVRLAEAEVKYIDRSVLSEQDLIALKSFSVQLGDHIGILTAAAKKISEALSQLYGKALSAPSDKPRNSIPEIIPPNYSKPGTSNDRNALPRMKPRGLGASKLYTPKELYTPGDLSGPEQRILDALAELEAIGIPEPPRMQVALFAGYTHLSSKGFSNSIGTLRSAGRIDYPRQGTIALTDQGRVAANQVTEPRSMTEIHARVKQLLGNVAARVLQPLLDAYPDALYRAELMALAGYGHASSKGFANTIGRLRSLGLIDYPTKGQVIASRILFPISETKHGRRRGARS